MENDFEFEYLSNKEMRQMIKLIKSDYNKALMDISALNEQINDKDEQINELIEFLEQNNQIASPLRNSNEEEEKEQMNKFQRNKKSSKLEITQLRRNFNKETEKVKCEEEEKTVALIDEAERKHLDFLNKLKDENNQVISDLQAKIRVVNEKMNREYIDVDEHKRLVSQITKKHCIEMEYLNNIKKEVLSENIIQLSRERLIELSNKLSGVANYKSEESKFHINISQSPAQGQPLNQPNAQLKSNRIPISSQRYKSENEANSEEEFEVEDEFSDDNSNFEIDDCNDEIKINKVNCLKIDTEFFEKKNRFLVN